MKEIKFRAWDKERENMIYQGSNTNKNNGWILGQFIFDDMQVGLIVTTYDEDVIEIIDFELMQFTGIKDKKDNEIYEGDIYKWTSTDTDGTTLTVYSIIVFEDGSFWAKDYKGRGRETIYECINYNSEYEYVELAGNIYENPELLEVK